jgi:chemotaxis-related protein WspD
MHERDLAPVHDCWNRIGVRGDRSCPQLDSHVHCRECPVYAAAAKTLLARVAPSLEPRSEAAPASAAAPAGAATSLLIFRLHAEWLALPTTALAEVTPMRPIHSLPRRAGIVLGVCNVRGRLAPCISLAALLDIAAPRQDARDDKPVPRMLVLTTHAGAVVAPVDDIAGIEAFPAAALGPLPDTLAGSRYAVGVARYRDRTVGLLDHARVARAIEGRLA